MLNRRAFLKTAVGTFSLLATGSFGAVLTAARPRRILVPEWRSITLDTQEIFESYMETLRPKPILREELAEGGENEEIKRTENELKVHDYSDYENTTYHNMAETDFYIVTHKNGLDVCLPFYPNYTFNKRKPMIEAAALIGLAATSASYKEKKKASEAELSELFIPTELKPKGHNAEEGSTLATTEMNPSNTLHPTRNGRLDIDYYPPNESGKAYVSVKVRGKINYDKTMSILLES